VVVCVNIRPAIIEFSVHCDQGNQRDVPGRLPLIMCLWWNWLYLAHVHIDNFTPTSHLPQLPSADSDGEPDMDNLGLFLHRVTFALLSFPPEKGGETPV
jgi:hypothetical protein